MPTLPFLYTSIYFSPESSPYPDRLSPYSIDPAGPHSVPWANNRILLSTVEPQLNASVELALALDELVNDLIIAVCFAIDV